MSNPPTSTSPSNNGSQPKEKETYVLQRNHVAATRLNLQHYIWRKELGYNIHPSIPIPAQGARIADVATGTALWLLEVAEEYPSAECDGFDIKLGQGPPDGWLPGNVKMFQWDMMDPLGVPAHLQNHYDFVHVRLVTLAVEDNVDPLVHNLFSMLKPGGWLQWDETNFDKPQKSHASGDPSKIGASMVKISELMTQRSGTAWFRELDTVLGKGGFERAERFETEPELKMLKFATDLMVMVWEEIVAMVDGEKKVMFAKLVEGFKGDVVNGSGIAHPKMITVARKPLHG